MLKPQNSPTRETITLDGLFAFKVDFDRVGLTEGWQNAPLDTDLEIAVPASFNDLFADEKIRNHVGYVWYQRDVQAPRGWRDERINIRVDAATHEGIVFVNGIKVAEHVGGYAPFEADITGLVKAGEVFRLTIAVNNELTPETIPPGRIEVTWDGRRQQKYMHDFYNYAGLHRSVRLFATPLVRLEDITVNTNLEGSTGVVNYQTVVANLPESAKVSVKLPDAKGNEVATADGTKGALRISDVKLWQPGAAYLYNFTVEVNDDGKLLDSYTLAIGVRTVEVKANQFLINGKPFYFAGFGMHEDHVVLGKAHNNALLVNDFQLLAWIGANSFRTSHYPYAEEVMEFADRHGIVVIDETPAVGLNGAFAGFFGAAGPVETFTDEFVSSRTQESHKQAIRELIARDKNHPSVVLWSIANEPNSSEKGARPYFEPLAQLTRELDPTRPVCFVNVAYDTPQKDIITDLFDVVLVNRYYGWYLNNADLASAEQALEKELREWEAKFIKPIIVSEYGADTMPGIHSIYDQPWSEEYQLKFLEMYHRVFDRVEFVIGEHVWNFADFQTAPGIMRVDGNKKGVFSRDRRPKASAFTLRERWRAMAAPRSAE